MPKGIPILGKNKGWFKKKRKPFNKGKSLSAKHIENLRNSHKGLPGNTKGKHWKLSEKSKKNIGNGQRGNKHWKWKGGLTMIEKLELRAGRKKPKECELCGREGKIVFDHDHKTGKFRGWICYKCNTALGMVNDNIETLLLMVKYIKSKCH